MRTKKAAVTAAAGEKKRQSTAYPKSAQLSSQKMLIGELIFFLHSPITQSQRKAGWQFFELLLGALFKGQGGKLNPWIMKLNL